MNAERHYSYKSMLAYMCSQLFNVENVTPPMQYHADRNKPYVLLKYMWTAERYDCDGVKHNTTNAS